MTHIAIELPWHLTTPTRGGHGNRYVKASDVRTKRSMTAAFLELEMGRYSAPDRAFSRVVVAKGANGRPLKKPYVRNVLGKTWHAILEGGIDVNFYRHAPRFLDDDDNLRAAFKAVKDGVTDAFGINDSRSETRVTWHYTQVKDPVSRAFVRVFWNLEETPE